MKIKYNICWRIPGGGGTRTHLSLAARLSEISDFVAATSSEIRLQTHSESENLSGHQISSMSVDRSVDRSGDVSVDRNVQQNGRPIGAVSVSRV